jgi:hypothetical protein
VIKGKNNSFSIQANVSRDFTNKTFVAFLRFVNDDEIYENFFCCKELPEKIKGNDILNVLSSYLETKCLSWENCEGICTVAATSMVGSIRGLGSLLE